MSPAPFQAAFDEFKKGSPELFEPSGEFQAFPNCDCETCDDANKQRERMLEKVFSVGFNAGVMAQAMKDAKEKQK
jgi:hypothetical protein